MSIDNLLHNVSLLVKQIFWLDHSYKAAFKIGSKKAYTLEEFDVFENLSSRFSRSIDFLIRKVFRSIDDAEFQNQGTLIDVVNNAHKRALFDSIEEFRQLKDMRNAIAHEYLDDSLLTHFDELLIQAPKLLKIMKSTHEYVEKQAF